MQWGLYYPPILAIGETSGLRPELAASLERAKQHDIAGALAALNRVPADERDGTFYLLEAALLLSVGRVDEALKIINQAIARNDRAGLAYALRAVIEVVKNEKVKALGRRKARRRARAESCGNQDCPILCATGEFRSEGRPRHACWRRPQLQPQNALAWARLGELWLMFGYRKRAREAAETGVRLAPDLERVHLVFGFAALTEFRTKMAREAFERAIELDSADPLARFGLGLAIIRDGPSMRAAVIWKWLSASIRPTRCFAPISARPISRRNATHSTPGNLPSPRCSIRSIPRRISTTRSACRA